MEIAYQKIGIEVAEIHPSNVATEGIETQKNTH